MKIEAIARWMEKGKGKGRMADKEKSLAKDISAGSVLRSKLREKGKSRIAEKDQRQKGSRRLQREKDISKDEFL